MAKRQKVPPTLSRIRSAVTNGRFLIAGIDHRSHWVRRLRDLVSNHTADLGGSDVVSHSEQILINRASMLELQLEMLEQRFSANDGEASSDQFERYQRGINTLRRTLEALGLQRRAKPVPDLATYLASRAQEKEEDAETVE